jgi:deoxyhypusine synthase
MASKQDFLKEVIKHINIKEHNVVPLVDAMESMAFSARDLNRASKIYDMMLKDKECAVILTLAGSIFSAGLKKVVFDLIDNNMVDAVVSTGALMVDQDFSRRLDLNIISAPLLLMIMLCVIFTSIEFTIHLLMKMNCAFAMIQRL